jgi:hypothetical protein
MLPHPRTTLLAYSPSTLLYKLYIFLVYETFTKTYCQNMNWKLHLCILVSIQLKFVTAQTADASASATANGAGATASATAIAIVSNMSPETIAQLGGMTIVNEAAGGWDQFKSQHSWCLYRFHRLHFFAGKAYASASAEQNRFTIYAGNYNFVKQHNSDPVLSKHYRVAINPMSDWVCSCIELCVYPFGSNS